MIKPLEINILTKNMKIELHKIKIADLCNNR